MTPWMASGMITIGVGLNDWAGGDNTSEFWLYTHMPQASLTVDGKRLIERGILKP